VDFFALLKAGGVWAKNGWFYWERAVLEDRIAGAGFIVTRAVLTVCCWWRNRTT